MIRIGYIIFKFLIRFFVLNLFFYFNLVFFISNFNEELTPFIVYNYFLKYTSIGGIDSIFYFFFDGIFYNKFFEYYNILHTYYNMLYFLIISFLISLVFFVVSFFFFTKSNKYNEKLLPYECGFDPFGDARKQFDIHFYLVAIFFIIFDIEAIFIFPWVISFYQLTNLGFFNMIDFIVELVIGFIYLLYVGALDWYNI